MTLNPLKISFKEMCYRKVNFLMVLFCVIISVATLSGSMTLLKLHDDKTEMILNEKEQETEEIMAKLKDEMRVAMLKLGLNLVILPDNQDMSNWYLEDSPQEYMPEAYVHTLAESGVITVRHFLPTLQQVIKWPEKDKRIVLIGTRGEVPNLHKSARNPIIQPVPDGKIVLGNELHKSLGLKVGDNVKLMGKKFIVHRCHSERGNQDDITAWIPLKDAQKLMDKKGKISSILALHCLCQGSALGSTRKDIQKVLPGTKVVELGKEKRLARAEARMAVGKKAKETLKKERNHRMQMRSEIKLFSSIFVIVILFSSCVWISFLAIANVRQRRNEIGIMQAVGINTKKIISLFLLRAIFISYTGSIIGVALGISIGCFAGIKIEGFDLQNINLIPLINADLLTMVFVVVPALTLISSLIPAIIASKQDPAIVIRKEAA